MGKALARSDKWGAHRNGKTGGYGNDRKSKITPKKNLRVPEGRGGGRVAIMKPQISIPTSEKITLLSFSPSASRVRNECSKLAILLAIFQYPTATHENA